MDIKEHLAKARKKAHKIMKKNGHYKKMNEASLLVRRKKKTLTKLTN